MAHLLNRLVCGVKKAEDCELPMVPLAFIINEISRDKVAIFALFDNCKNHPTKVTKGSEALIF